MLRDVIEEMDVKEIGGSIWIGLSWLMIRQMY
jgi:hypothetical protein